jgi:hypothetical protein
VARAGGSHTPEALAALAALGLTEGNIRVALHRLRAHFAALAAAGEGGSELVSDDAVGAKFRGQALDWLKDGLAAWAKCLYGGDPKLQVLAAQTLQHWKSGTDLTGNLDPDAPTKLPEAERMEWQAPRATVDAVLSTARSGRT